MIIPDLNLLIYAYNQGAPAHERAAVWWSECLNGTETVGLPMPVLFGFVRLTTSGRVFARPLSAAVAANHVRTWLSRPVATVLEPPAAHVAEVLAVLEALGTAGNLVTDAQLAALAVTHRAVVHTADAHFPRFPGVRWFNPLTGQEG